MMRLITLLFICSLFQNDLLAQEIRKKEFSISRDKTVFPSEIEESFNPVIHNLEAPYPGGRSEKSHLLDQKIKAREYQRQQKPDLPKPIEKTQETPIIGNTFEPVYYHPSGNPFPIIAGIPSDNTLAVSNEGIVVVAMNSVVYAHDMNSDTAVFPSYRIFLRDFVDGFSTSSYYDPKLIYDAEEDKFVLVLLKDSDPSKSEVIVCFSSSNDPNDPWYIYNLPGNPLNNNRWTDFPAISLTHDKLYFTGNLIIPNEPWQTGFDGSIIWEMDKKAGFSGETSINAVLYDNITYGGNYIRNLHTVQGGGGNAETLFLLSNRNFDVSNDTIFFLELTDGNLSVEPLVSDVAYGVPPNARQFDTDTSDPNNGLQTNDARVLGAVLIDDEIQFVGNTMNPATGFCAVYHGLVSNVFNSPAVTANIIGDSIKDFGYPNIAWSGNEDCDREVIIAFDHSSFTDFPGNSAIYCNNERMYSQVLQVKEGYNYVDRLPTGYERWGDYYGLQRKFNDDGTVYSFGYLALQSKSNSGYCAVLKSPDSTALDFDLTVALPQNFCNNRIFAQVQYGHPPYTYTWNGGGSTTDNSVNGFCTGDTITCTVKDNRGCELTKSLVVPISPLDNGNVYPNPAGDFAAVQFEMAQDGIVEALLYDSRGRLVKELAELPAKSGLNEFTFSLIPLAGGTYNLVLVSEGQILKNHKIIKR
ncbi:MAG: T9SS type A sorting domain-containing protein [Brumimicrobium sp.]|nr:T9SS type A sorting domain-containing protein [Brumimicrobium sp.]